MNFFDRRELFLQIGKRLFYDLAVAGILAGPELLPKVRLGEK